VRANCAKAALKKITTNKAALLQALQQLQPADETIAKELHALQKVF
jgi:hypothetical protein